MQQSIEDSDDHQEKLRMNHQELEPKTRRVSSSVKALLAALPIAAAAAAGMLWPSSSEAVIFGDCYGPAPGSLYCDCDADDIVPHCNTKLSQSGSENCGALSTPRCFDHDGCQYENPCGGEY
jgi:hypothetical protein